MSDLYNHDHENEITIFAETNFRNQRRRFGIKTDDRRRHMYIIGKTGMGKTQLQENMVMSDIMAGHGVCYIDPHGDTAEKILDYVPANRINDVVYFNPADMEYPVGFNILETVNDSQKHLVASGLMGVFKKIWPDVWSPRMEYILLNCVLALLDYPGATLLGINRLLVDQDYRNRVIAKIRDPIVKTFWVAEFTSWEVKYQTEAIAPIQNKVGQFLSASIIRNIVSQVRSTVDIRKIMDEGKIFIVNLSKGRIGEENMKLLGGMLISRLQMAAMERVDMPEAERRDFYLFVDEFQNFANESFASILSEARKYRLNLIVAHQYIEQLTDEVKAAIVGNVGTIISFRIGGTDAEFLEKEFTPTFTSEDLVNLAKYTIYLKLMVDGVSTAPFSASTLPPMAQFTGNAQKVIGVSRERYAMPRATIAEKVLRWSGMESSTLRAATGSAEENLEEKDLNINIKDLIIKEQDENSKKIDSGPLRDMKESQKESLLDEFGPSDQEEYLKISPERLKALVKPTQSKKKEKPMYSHTCTRCGKVWEMPIQLDPSRPMFCADCMPIVKEEQKKKGKIAKSSPELPPLSDGRPPQGPNRPRVIGDVPALQRESRPEPRPPRQEDRPQRKENGSSGLLAELQKIKGKPVETRKSSVENRTNQISKPPRNEADEFKARAEAPGSKVENFFSKLDEARESSGPEISGSVVISKQGSSPKTLRPGQKITF